MEGNLIPNPNAKTVQDYFTKAKEEDVLEVSMIEDIARKRELDIDEARRRFVMVTIFADRRIVGYKLASRYVNEKDERYRI